MYEVFNPFMPIMYVLAICIHGYSFTKTSNKYCFHSYRCDS